MHTFRHKRVLIMLYIKKKLFWINYCVWLSMNMRFRFQIGNVNNYDVLILL